MVIQVAKTKNKRTNYFITTEEAKLMWQYTSQWGSKYQVMLGFALFRGMRIGEIVAINLYDFQNSSFNKLNIILNKSHIQDDFPLLKEFNTVLQDYIQKNKHTMRDGYIFPWHKRVNHRKPHMTRDSAEAIMSKIRYGLGEEYPQFLEHVKVNGGGPGRRYRICWHSCRRWFETILWEKFKDKMLIRDVMRYRHSKVVDVYINPYETWKNEDKILENTFGSLFNDFQQVGEGQRKITNFL